MNLQERVLLCRPHGGLNDTLSVIERCWCYAESTNRQLILDMSRSAFCTNFASIFINKSESNTTLFEVSDSCLRQLNLKTCFPSVLETRIDSYVTRIQLHESISHLEWRRPVEDESSISLALSFDKDYSADLVVHEGYRANALASSLLRRVKFQKKIGDEICVRLKHLRTQKYLGVHIRNSDLKSDYINFFQRMKNRFDNQVVLICSDDFQVLDYGKSFLDTSHVLTSSEVPDLGGLPYQLAFVEGEQAKSKLSLDALVDLIALSEAEEIFSTSIVNRTDSLSGYSQLAKELWADKSIVKGLFE